MSEHARVYQSELSSDIPHGYHSREEDTRQPGPNVQEVRGGVSAHIQNIHAKQACNDAHSVSSRSLIALCVNAAHLLKIKSKSQHSCTGLQRLQLDDNLVLTNDKTIHVCSQNKQNVMVCWCGR